MRGKNIQDLIASKKNIQSKFITAGKQGLSEERGKRDTTNIKYFLFYHPPRGYVAKNEKENEEKKMTALANLFKIFCIKNSQEEDTNISRES